MKELNEYQVANVAGGNFLLGYIGGHLMDLLLTEAWNTHNMFQDDNFSLPYNRL